MCLPVCFCAQTEGLHARPAQTAGLSCSAGIPALLIDLESLAELVSIGTLIVFFVISAAVLWQRHFNPGGQSNVWLVLRLIGLCITALGSRWPNSIT